MTSTPKHPEAVTITSVIGIDPGPTTGICLLDYVSGCAYPLPECNVTLIQTPAANAARVLEAYLVHYYQDSRVTKRYGAVEAFRTGNAAGTKMKTGDLTRQYVMTLTETLQLFGYYTQIRPAADIKPWATDKRLVRAGIIVNTSLKHAGDAGRHALYAAVKDANMKDPLA